MAQLNTTQQAMLANLQALHGIAQDLARITGDSLQYAQEGEQNTMVGGLVEAAQPLIAAQGLYDAILALHRLNPQR
jgi:hypothetical protein